MGQHPHSHPHAHNHDGDGEAEALLSALSGGADRGSRVTLLGLAANIGLTLIKAAAGYTLSSAALIADAGHGLSDLLGDFVTLGTWKLARRPPTKAYPYGFGRYESLGALVVAFFLLAGGFGIGLHSYHLLAGVERDGPGHGGEDGDARAAVFALLSIVVKEYLYRVTMAVAKEERSRVLTASALHHRSDAQSSVVALLAIGASSLGFPVFDPLGGLVVAAMILHGGSSIGYAAFADLVDQSADPSLLSDVQALIQTLLSTAPAAKAAALVDDEVTLFKAGGKVIVDVLLRVPSDWPVSRTSQLAQTVKGAVLGEQPNVKEVLVRFKAA